MYITICEIDHQSKFDASNRAWKAGALGQPRGMGWGGRWEGDSGWGTHVYSRLIDFSIWQKPLQCCKVISLQLKKKKKNPHAVQKMQEMWVWSLGWEDPLEKGGGMDTQSSIPAWRTPRTEDTGGLQSIGLPRVEHDWSNWAHTHIRKIPHVMGQLSPCSTTTELAHPREATAVKNSPACHN